jgi:hypothetical protein
MKKMLFFSGLLAVYLMGFARYNINYDGTMVFGSEWAEAGNIHAPYPDTLNADTGLILFADSSFEGIGIDKADLTGQGIPDDVAEELEDVLDDINFSNFKTIVYEEVDEKHPFNNKIKECVFTLNGKPDPGIISKLADSLYSWSAGNKICGMSFIINNRNKYNGNGGRRYILSDLKPMLINDFKGREVEVTCKGQRRLTDTNDPKTGEPWRKNYYCIVFVLNENGRKRDFLTIDVNKGHIKNILYCFNGNS